MENLFFELIQVAIGTRDCLTRHPSTEEWYALFEMAKKQSLVGICFVGVQKLYNANVNPNANHSNSTNLSKLLYLTWMGLAAKVQQRNDTVNQQCVDVIQQFRDRGLESCILKGQGVACYYNADLKRLRQSGDIDIWVNGTWQQVMDYVNSISPNREFDMKHTHLEAFEDTIVEVHWWPSMPINPMYQAPLHKYYLEQAPIQCAHQLLLPNGVDRIYAPDAVFETVHIMYHAFSHFLYEGVGLRQMMDLYFVLTNGLKDDKERTEVMSVAQRIGLGRFVPAAMWVMETVFGMDAQYSLCNADQDLGQTLLTEIVDGGNFGHHSSENRVTNESFFARMRRRFRRRIRLVKYNPIGMLCSPFTKIRILLWKQKVIKLYNL